MSSRSEHEQKSSVMAEYVPVKVLCASLPEQIEAEKTFKNDFQNRDTHKNFMMG